MFRPKTYQKNYYFRKLDIYELPENDTYLVSLLCRNSLTQHLVYVLS
jgi:hypothetical protein